MFDRTYLYPHHTPMTYIVVSVYICGDMQNTYQTLCYKLGDFVLLKTAKTKHCAKVTNVSMFMVYTTRAYPCVTPMS